MRSPEGWVARPLAGAARTLASRRVLPPWAAGLLGALRTNELFSLGVCM